MNTNIIECALRILKEPNKMSTFSTQDFADQVIECLHRLGGHKGVIMAGYASNKILIGVVK